MHCGPSLAGRQHALWARAGDGRTSAVEGPAAHHDLDVPSAGRHGVLGVAVSAAGRRVGAGVLVCSVGGCDAWLWRLHRGRRGGADATRERGAWVGGLGRRDVDKLLYRPWLAPAAAGKLDPCVRARPGRRRLALFTAQNNFHPLTPTPRRPHIPQTAPTRSFHCAPAMPTAPAASPSPRAHV